MVSSNESNSSGNSFQSLLELEKQTLDVYPISAIILDLVSQKKCGLDAIEEFLRLNNSRIHLIAVKGAPWGLRITHLSETDKEAPYQLFISTKETAVEEMLAHSENEQENIQKLKQTGFLLFDVELDEYLSGDEDGLGEVLLN